MKRFFTFLVTAMVALSSAPAFAWSECGHAIIMQLAYLNSSAAERAEIERLMKAHPRFVDDFAPPSGIQADGGKLAWRIGRIGYWPDVARRQPEYHRSTWHYQLGASLVIGDETKLQVPEAPGPVPADATLATQELHLIQAVELCKSVLRDKNRPDADRAVALCWIAHLVADAHQPCHAGSLYVEGVFTEKDGDRGANRILTAQRGNMHALWDQLLGDRYDEGDVKRRADEIAKLDVDAGSKEQQIDPTVWIDESRKFAIESVYTDEVLSQVALVSRGLATEVPKVDLSEAYLKNAGRVAQERAKLASVRLAAVIAECSQ
ncbi:S1/P1 Nuclease [Pirellula sp. SH-Sr6A]|uniref:S1/P1 nuclease n=1 Tax=Pirellula sp. SH-Sr6A TaxID=1632865 RepID=UPI00078B2C3D|nr:S1/P1 nuclease [Pirellula sp. SH-Sr6A]AMV35621.1 S1/P1 Nuclease [Pirellula sp. SH-Sr6A]